MRTNSPVMLVRKSSRPYFDSRSERNAFGTLSLPLSSIRAGALPLNTRHYSTELHKIPPDGRERLGRSQPQKIVAEPVTSYFRPFLAHASGRTVVRPRSDPGPTSKKGARATIPGSHACSGRHSSASDPAAKL